MIFICPICNKEFKASSSRQKRSKAVYCSRKCYAESLKNSKRPQWVCDKISKGITGENNPFYGKTHSTKTKQQISKSRKGKYSGSRHHMKNNAPIGIDAYHWKGGVGVRRHYIEQSAPNHPLVDCRGYVRQHRLIAEDILGRYLGQSEKIHHIDFNPHNNNPTNLFVFETQSAHASFHNCVKHQQLPKNWLKSNIV